MEANHKEIHDSRSKQDNIMEINDVLNGGLQKCCASVSTGVILSINSRFNPSQAERIHIYSLTPIFSIQKTQTQNLI